MKKYKVVLGENSTAKPEQIIDGCLGNGFNSGAVHNQYSRGEALKKARMFGGKIAFVNETKYVYMEINSREGDVEVTIKDVEEVDVAEDIKELAEDYARNFHGFDDVEDTGKEYLQNSGCIATSVLSVKEIDQEDFEVLYRYL